MLEPEVVAVVAVAAAGTAAVALLLALVLLARLRRLQRALAVPVPPPPQGVNRPAGDDALRKVGLVRYDAFEDIGGGQSFSAALLDEGGNGVVLTAIHGRGESRTYGKAVRGGTSEHTLSPEEQQAIAQARG